MQCSGSGVLFTEHASFDRGINKIVQFSNIRTQKRIICAQFMFMPPQSPHSCLHKSQELENGMP